MGVAPEEPAIKMAARDGRVMVLAAAAAVRRLLVVRVGLISPQEEVDQAMEVLVCLLLAVPVVPVACRGEAVVAAERQEETERLVVTLLLVRVEHLKQERMVMTLLAPPAVVPLLELVEMD